MYAPSPAASTRRTNKERALRMALPSNLRPSLCPSSTPFPPDANAVPDEQRRHNEHGEVEHHALLVGCHCERAIVRTLRPNGDQILLLSQPVRHVQEDVAVSLNPKGPIRGEV